MSPSIMIHTTIPLIIGGKDVVLHLDDHKYRISSPDSPAVLNFQGATVELALEGVESSAAAFPAWAQTAPAKRREMLQKVAQLLRNKSSEARALVESEIHCGPLWAEINVEDGIGLIEETAALVTDAMSGVIPPTRGDSYALVFKEPLGVVLGIAPWNAPMILGLRAIVPALAAGNAVILKGSEMSPRCHYFIASLFREAGFPPGVVNFILHRPQDASEVYEAIISRPEVKKCNFTGSTQVGRSIASKAAFALKPVLLELGGKNFTILLEDADLDSAARHIVTGAYLNNGQICMSTDLVYAVKSVVDTLSSKLLAHLADERNPYRVISPSGKARLTSLVEDARSKGATIHHSAGDLTAEDLTCPATIIEGVTPEMDFFHTESFGPVLGIVTVDSEEEALKLANGSAYGLSAAVFSQNHFRALEIARQIQAGAVHVNSSTVHDEPTLPHGGYGDSGWGRFGSKWGLEEFLQTRTVILNR